MSDSAQQEPVLEPQEEPELSQNQEEEGWWKNDNFKLSKESFKVQEKMERQHKLLVKSRKNVVKIFSSQSNRSFAYPWQVRNSGVKYGSGLIIDYKRKRILTNAHCVANSTALAVQRYGSSIKYEARILCIGYQSDLSLLTVDDPGFWGEEPEEGCIFAELPPLQSHATVIGFPTGGDNLSITRGVVSRVELRTYVNCSLLTIQIDAAINPGNSGGPAFNDDGHVIGIAFQYLSQASNIGFIIPTEVVKHFLDGVERTQGLTPSVCFTGLAYQLVENASHRRQLGIQKNGVLIIQKVYGNILPGDVLLAIDGHEISREGTIELRADEHINFNYYVRNKFLGDHVTFTVNRNGQIIEVDHMLYDGNCLVPDVQDYNCEPTFIMVGGLVFIPLSMPYLSEWYGSDWSQKAPFRILMDVFHGEWNRKLIVQDVPEEVVCVSLILPHKVNMGYTISHLTQITHFNDKRIFNMIQLFNMIKNNEEDYFRFRSVSKHDMILGRAEVMESMQEIFYQHGLPTWYSPNLETDYVFKNTVQPVPKNVKKFIQDTIYVGIEDRFKLVDELKLEDDNIEAIAELSSTTPLTQKVPQEIFQQSLPPQQNIVQDHAYPPQ